MTNARTHLRALSRTPPEEADVIPPELALAFAPLHKRAFGTAIGVAGGIGFFLLTAIELIRRPAAGVPLGLLGEYFYGYTVSWTGAFVGLFWGLAVGFVAGWFVAFCRNVALAVSVFISRTRGELEATRDFLDHI